jgi:signal transduction histidine kinase
VEARRAADARQGGINLKPVVATRLLTLVSAALPFLLILSAWQTYRSLEEQKDVYLRSRVAALAARLETIPEDKGNRINQQWLEETLGAEEPGLAAIAILTGSTPDLAPIWRGDELFRFERTAQGIFRAYIPFHGAGGTLRVARIDLAESTADFLVTPARRHLVLVILGGVLIVALSITATRARKRHLQLEHLALLGEMSAGMAHEIRNPLGTIKGYAQLLAEQPQTNPAFVQPILEETSRLELFVKDLLLYGRPATPSPASVDSARVAELIERHALRYTGKVSFRSTVSPFHVRTDLYLLEQILLNLLRNAAEVATAIRFEARSEGRDAVLQLVDNGPGLSGEAERRLYEPFFTSKASGTGLGLCISRKLAAALGGTLRVANVASGHGVIAEVRLPLAHAQAGGPGA